MEISSQSSDVALNDEIKQLVATHTTLEKLLVWGVGQSPPVMIGEVIAQDEFTNDIVVPYKHLYLAYDTT